MADNTFEALVEQVDKLPPQQQTQLIAHLLEAAKKRKLSVDEKMTLLRAAQVHVEVLEEPSIRRVDWYGDDGR